MDNKILLTIIIASLNRHNELIKCLLSIKKIFPMKYILDQIQIIVVDQSDEANHDLCRDLKGMNFTYIHSTIRNASHARNLGAQYADSKYLWFLDDDAEVLSFRFESLLDERNIFFISWREKRHVFEKLYRYNKLNIIRRSGTPFYLLKKKCFDDVGGFNLDLGPGSVIRGGEDLDLLIRVNSKYSIEDFSIHGELTHPLNASDEAKKSSYYFARGYVLALNDEFMLFLVNLIYDIAISYRCGLNRAGMLIKGFIYCKRL